MAPVFNYDYVQVSLTNTCINKIIANRHNKSYRNNLVSGLFFSVEGFQLHHSVTMLCSVCLPTMQAKLFEMARYAGTVGMP